MDIQVQEPVELVVRPKDGVGVANVWALVGAHTCLLVFLLAKVEALTLYGVQDMITMIFLSLCLSLGNTVHRLEFLVKTLNLMGPHKKHIRKFQ